MEQIGTCVKRRDALKENEKNLKLRLEEMMTLMEQEHRCDYEDVLKAKRRDLHLMKSAVQAAQCEEQSLQNALEDISQRLSSKQIEWNQLQNADALSEGRRIVEHQVVSKIDNERQALVQMKEDIERKIREIGSIPKEAFGKYNDKTKRVWMF